MSADAMVGQDPSTQRMVEEARENFPNKPEDEALQQQADMGSGHEAAKGEGGGTTGVIETVKEAAASAVDTLKQSNPATRDMKEPHC